MIENMQPKLQRVEKEVEALTEQNQNLELQF